MEVCIDNIESALNARDGGAKRLEVCSSLAEGGLTPSVGLLKLIKTHIDLPAFVMIRPRGGDFVYSEDEVRIMEMDIESLLDAGADGIVVGCLTVTGEVDVSNVRRLVGVAEAAWKGKKGLEMTFHRAIDMVKDMSGSVRVVKELGFKRILTSGGAASALLGLQDITSIIREFGEELIVMPGGGINDTNLEEILKTLGATEFHASARHRKESTMEFKNEVCSMGTNSEEFSILVTSLEKVERLMDIYNTYWAMHEKRLLEYATPKT